MPLLGVNTHEQLIDLAHANHHLLTLREVRAAGVGPERWERLRRDGPWVRVVPGVWRHMATPITWEMKVRAGALWLGKHGAPFGPTALAWWGVDGCGTDAVEFLIPRSRRSLVPWMTLHTTLDWPRRHILRHNGIRVCDVTRAILDSARTESAAYLANAIDSAVRARRTSVPTLTNRLHTVGLGRPGSALLRELLLDSGGESYLERRFLRLVREHGLPRPNPQVVYRPRGTRVIRVDFEFPATNVVIEVSGRLGHVSDLDRTRDAARRNWLQQEHGKRVLEFTTTHVIDDPAYVVATLAREPPRRAA